MISGSGGLLFLGATRQLSREFSKSQEYRFGIAGPRHVGPLQQQDKADSTLDPILFGSLPL